ncbi:Serine proteinase stubble [Orchesella cincta]|uniref:Serine proteinase stubble n=1 Tax=Orchesella cincta TaxID=48709 RepID=A0A1D2N1Y4_ORCCI|nr:Serine proteinase stubble [Orchesella cincta]
MGLILRGIVLCSVFWACYGFRSPLDKSLSLPYGRLMRAQMSGRIVTTYEGEEQPDDLQWWHGISRNNTIDCRCGTFKVSSQADRWENERVSALNVYPWSVSLVSPGSLYSFCGGSLVNDRYILTAASCVDGTAANQVDVLIGTWPNAHFPNMTNPDEANSSPVFRKRVHRVIIHPKYIDRHLDYNIALLRLEGPVPTYGNARELSPVCLPEQDYSYDGMNSSSFLWRFRDLDGIVVPEKRSEVQSKVLSKKECKSVEFSKEWMQMPDTMMCSKMGFPDKDHPYYSSYDCPGDAGSPLMVRKGNQIFQIGIDSWSACYGRPKGIGVYTRVAAFLPWIKLHISEDGRLCSK